MTYPGPNRVEPAAASVPLDPELVYDYNAFMTWPWGHDVQSLLCPTTWIAIPTGHMEPLHKCIMQPVAASKNNDPSHWYQEAGGGQDGH